jgi:DNA mismatch endonuclease (patch repair protein)
MPAMTDVVTPEVRSRMMAGIRGKDTQPEMQVRRFLHRRGLRYRLHVRGLPGTPDLVFPRYGAVVFVHGCYWHRHVGCKYASTPASKGDFWNAKFAANVRRDRETVTRLTEAGWRVIVLWECGLRRVNSDSELVWLLAEIQHGSRTFVEWP